MHVAIPDLESFSSVPLPGGELAVTERLSAEHRWILELLDLLEAVCDRLSETAALPPGSLHRAVTLVVELSDVCHHAKEEQVLFPALESAGMPSHGGPVAVMRHEHELFRSFVRTMSDSSETASRGAGPGRTRFIDASLRFIEGLREHIAKEDEILFPMAENLLDDEAKQRVLAGYRETEGAAVGPHAHARFRAELEALRRDLLGGRP